MYVFSHENSFKEGISINSNYQALVTGTNVWKGDLDKKRKILASLGGYVEPTLKSRVLQNSGYKQLESDIGFVLNNFNIRHNNKTGAKAQDYIISCSDKELEGWYDKAYNMLVAVIIINEHISVQQELAEIKSKYKWKS